MSLQAPAVDATRFATTPDVAAPAPAHAPDDAGSSWLNLPREFAASLLAITTVPMGLPPTHLPPWAVFISWAGTFAAGGPKPEVLRKLAPTQPVGSLVAMVIVLCFGAAADALPAGAPTVFAEMGILFVLNSAMIFLARVVPALSFVPGMFFGFASYFATYFGGFGLEAGNEFHALWAAVAMNAVGLLYAWLNVKLMRPADRHH
jgi:hypothetical protein